MSVIRRALATRKDSVTKLPRSNIFSASADELSDLFADYLDREGACIVLAISERPLSGDARNAIEKSLESFGYGDGACMYATLLPADEEAEGGDVPLDAQALFLLLEGLDPLCVICADGAAASRLGEACRATFEQDAPIRAFGRPGVAFRNLTALLDTDAGKQHAWRLLKSLPKR